MYTRTAELFKLVGQTKVKIDSTGSFSFPLGEGEHISVQEGDIIGVYFPYFNPITYNSRACYAPEERLRYNPEPPDLSAAGAEVEFDTASLSWDPCRSYSIEAVIGE